MNQHRIIEQNIKTHAISFLWNKFNRAPEVNVWYDEDAGNYLLSCRSFGTRFDFPLTAWGPTIESSLVAYFGS